MKYHIISSIAKVKLGINQDTYMEVSLRPNAFVISSHNHGTCVRECLFVYKSTAHVHAYVELAH